MTMSQDSLARAIVTALGGKWHRSQGLCRCPAHEDNSPSLSIRGGNRSILVHCFAGCDGKDVMRELRTRGLLEPTLAVAVPNSISLGTTDTGDFARKLWSAGKPTSKTMADNYLLSRGIKLRSPALRFLRSAQVGPKEAEVRRPAMIAAVTDNEGLVVAVQRTFLDPPGRKAAIDSPRRALGPVTAGIVKLAPIEADGRIGIAEGVETALSATQLHGIPCWATLGTEMFGMRPLPDGAREVLLFLDNGPGGRRAEELARQWTTPGRTLLPMRPPERFGDWNDALQNEGPVIR
jgi:putative DNA primase/helicase